MKSICVYLVLAVVCFPLVYLTGCKQSKSNMSQQTHISNGEYTAQINGLELWYKVSGSGPVCILPTPGWGPSSELYFITLKPLEATFTMVYLDTRGSGRSGRPELNAYTMHNFVADIEGLRSHLEVESIWLMGHSAGGPMILNYASEYSGHVEGIILVDAPMEDTSKGNERIKRMQLRKDESWFDKAFNAFQKPPTTQDEFETYIQTILPFFFASVESLEKNRDVFEKMSLSFHATQGLNQSDHSSPDLGAFLPNMMTPTLIIVGEEDFLYTPSVAEHLHSMIANSKLLIIENSGHFPWLEQPQQFFSGVQSALPELGYHNKRQ